MQNEIQEQVEVVLRERPTLAVITCHDDAQTVATFRGKIKDLLKKMDAYFDDNIKKAHELHKGLVAQKKEAVSRPLEVDAACNKLITAWQVAEQNRIRWAQEEADHKAQEEANRLAKLEAIEQAKREAEAARIAAAEAKAAGDKRAMERARLEAEEARKQAVAIKSGAVRVVAAPVASVAVDQGPKIEGVSLRETWGAEVTDMVALCKAIGAGKCGVEYVEANMTALNGVARATKGQMVIPGVRCVKKFGTASR